MLLKNCLVGWRGILRGLRDSRRHRRQFGRAVEQLEPRWLLADFGDAPDTTSGTGRGDYQTLAANGGPSHTIVAGLFLGARVDNDANGVPNARANGDDTTGSPDDEDGVAYPDADLVLTVGTQPTVTLRATNTTGTNANLFGWIDYNADGVFDNLTERASTVVQTGTNNGLFTLLFPVVTTGLTGTTYARFRLSSDATSSNPTGTTNGGEVEDYAVSILSPSDGTVGANTKIASGLNGGPTLANYDDFGSSVAALGDVDGDGVGDIAVGAIRDDTGGPYRGAVYLLRLNANGTVKSNTKLASGTNGVPTLDNGDFFGSSVAALGDVDGDGVGDIAVGAYQDSTGGSYRGAVYVLRLNGDGTVKSSTRIASGTNGGPTLEDAGRFGSSVAALGDLDGDGVGDIVVGAHIDDPFASRGAVYVLRLNGDGTVKSSTKIASGTGGGPTLGNNSRFGRSAVALGDVDGDGVGDIAVGADRDDTGGSSRGAVYVLRLNSNGTVKSSTTIASGTNGGPILATDDYFGSSMAALGDVDGDGVGDIAVGASKESTAGFNRGAVHLLLLSADGTVKSSTKIASGLNGGPLLENSNRFGSSVTALGDINGDGVNDLAVGTPRDNTNGLSRGAVYLLRLNAGPDPRDFGDAPDTGTGTNRGNYETLLNDGGPSHGIVNGLLLGRRIDGETDATVDGQASGDDFAGLDDEDSAILPPAGIVVTAGSQPSLFVRVTNTTGRTATVWGWIDVNADGLFDSATERAVATVASGVVDVTVNLVFPVVPAGFTGTTFARFRLSTDLAAANPTGAATDGEVEDYSVRIVVQSSGTVKTGGTTKLAHGLNGVPSLSDLGRFGASAVGIGDVDGDGVGDVAVGVPTESYASNRQGAVLILRLTADGKVKASTRISQGVNGGPNLGTTAAFGTSVTTLGDIDGDGVPDVAVGAPGDSVIHILRLTSTGAVKANGATRLATNVGGLTPQLVAGVLGEDIAAIGDVDGDGVGDLVYLHTGGIVVLYLRADGTVQSGKVSTLFPNGGTYGYASPNSVAGLGDVDGDGVMDVAVGVPSDDTAGTDRGAVHVVLLNSDGSVKQLVKLASGLGGLPALTNSELFGGSIAGVGDLDGDGVPDMVVGAPGAGSGRGAVQVLRMNRDGTVKSSLRFTSGQQGLPSLLAGDGLGGAITRLGDIDGDGVLDLAVGASGDDLGGSNRGALYILRLNAAEPVRDFGDAPDTGTGTGRGNYRTTSADGGPSHLPRAGLSLGMRVSGETFPQFQGNALGDDLGLDDEDGLASPVYGVRFIVGTQPSISVRVTNTTGTAAFLATWVDYNADGVFDNTSERAQTVVPSGTDAGLFTLLLPVVPAGYLGDSYLRIRLSTDAAALTSTGPATDGEVEDHLVRVSLPGNGFMTGGEALRIASTTGTLPTIADSDFFGAGSALLGDLNGDGHVEVAVGTRGSMESFVHILSLRSNGTVFSTTTIGNGLNGGPAIALGERFGNSVTNLGDLDGDGVTDLAVGANNTLGAGAVYVLFLNTNGTVKSSTRISSGENGGPALLPGDRFGRAVARLGDIDGDGVTDLAVGANGDDATNYIDRGAVHILFLRANGTVKSSSKIGSGTPGGPTLADVDLFGNSLASLGDFDQDGVPDLAVGAGNDDTGGTDRGAIYVLRLTSSGSPKAITKIANAIGGGPTLSNGDLFGAAIANLGDINGDGVLDLAVGTPAAGQFGTGPGAVYVLRLNGDGTVKSTSRITDGVNGGPAMSEDDAFGRSLGNLGDLDQDGFIDLAVGAEGDDTGGPSRGAVYFLRLGAGGVVRQGTKVASVMNGNPPIQDGDKVGTAVASLGDLDGNGVVDLVLGIPDFDTAGAGTGAVRIFLRNSDGTSSISGGGTILGGASGLPTMSNGDGFGRSVAVLGDIDGDGVIDIAVGADGDDTGGANRGAVYILRLTAGGRIKGVTKLDGEMSGLIGLTDDSFFGSSVTGLGDIDGDGVPDLAVGASGFNNYGNATGAVFVLRLRSDGTLKPSGVTRLSSNSGGLTFSLQPGERFGSAVAALGDVDGDGVTDLAVGSDQRIGPQGIQGGIQVLLLSRTGDVKAGSARQIGSGSPGLTFNIGDRFGASLAAPGDFDGDGVVDLLVGAPGDSANGTERGAIYAIFLQGDGRLKSSTRFASGSPGIPPLMGGALLGSSLAVIGDINGDGSVDVAAGAPGDDTGGTDRGAVHVLFVQPGSPLRDFGDAPDTGPGTGTGDYQTLLSDGGPSHGISARVFIGTRIGGEADGLQNSSATGDDRGTDDEDGVVAVLGRLVFTTGSQPEIDVRVTNLTTSSATLYAWIDFDGDGLFENDTERVSAIVRPQSNNVSIELVFPVLQTGFSGPTFARFRLSTDIATANSTGAALDGEVEDYAVTIQRPSSGTVRSEGVTRLPGGVDFSQFGAALATLGDLDGDRLPELVRQGSSKVEILFLSADGTVRSSFEINTASYPELQSAGPLFGNGVAGIGDIDGDGIPDLAVSAPGRFSTFQSYDGAVYLLRMRSNGQVKTGGITKLATGVNGVPSILAGNEFGQSITALGDIDGDGITDLAVGASREAGEGVDRGAVYIFRLTSDGFVKSTTRIASGVGGGPVLADGDYFGRAIVAVGDIDGDGIADLAVGAHRDDTGGTDRGAVYLLRLNADGSVKPGGITKLASGLNGAPVPTERFGLAVAALGDIDGDGIPDLAVGEPRNDTGGYNRGAIHILRLTTEGAVKAGGANLIAHQAGGGPTLVDNVRFGSAIANLGDLDGDGVIDLAVGAPNENGTGTAQGAVYILRLNAASTKRDFGDAPDFVTGTNRGDYRTREEDGGPSHNVVPGLLLGHRVSGDDFVAAGTGAVGDDLGVDDEDGVVAPLVDLVATIGATSTISVRATNLTGTNATLSGWIDLNADGVFDDATERAQATVPPGVNGGIFTLHFGATPAGFTGITYARFRIGNDDAATHPTGASLAGEVEDYLVRIVAPGRGEVRLDGFPELPSDLDIGPVLSSGDRFGSAVAGLGDLNGDGTADLVVGARGTFGDDQGAVHIQFLSPAGTTLATALIGGGSNAAGLSTLPNDRFGTAIANLGDLDGDGVVDLAVGAPGDDTGGDDRGAVYILFLNADGTLKSFSRIAHESGGGPTLADRDYFGSAVTAVGDIDGDGVTELAVGVPGDDFGGNQRGAVYLLNLNRNGTAKGSTKLASGLAGVPRLRNGDRFGWSLAGFSDLDGDGLPELLVGAPTTDSNDGAQLDLGAVYVLFLNPDGTTSVAKNRRIGVSVDVGLSLMAGDRFGSSLAALGDLDGDGVGDLAVGAAGDSVVGVDTGEVYVLLLNADGTSKTGIQRLTGKPATQLPLVDGDLFGTSIANLGDLDGDGVIDLAVGAEGDDRGGAETENRGTVYLLRLELSRQGIFGTVYEDLDGDGVRGFGEPAFVGASVYLDLNNNGLFDIGEPTRTTNGFGQYAFETLDSDIAPLIPGTHPVSFTVRQDRGPQILQTGPSARSYYNIFVDRLRGVFDQDFGNIQLAAGERVLGLPDRILASGEVVTLPIVLSQGGSVNAINFTLVFDNSVVEILSIENGTLTSLWTFSERNIDNAGGRVDVEMASFTALGSGSGEVGRITLRVKQNVPDGRASPLRFVDGSVFPYLEAATVLNGGTIPFVEGEGAILVINPPSLRVVEVVPEPSGLNLKFNMPYGTSTLNLYRGFERGDGLPDVTLVGSNGPVPGSLVLAEDRRSARYVARGGILPAGTYTLTVLGGATGWLTVDGRQLDGNSDGVTGDAFTQTITMAATTSPIVSLPDFARGPGQSVNIPTSASGLPVRISDAAGLTRVELELTYDPTLLTITGVRAGANLPGNWTITPTFVNGRVSWIAQGGTALSSGAAELFRLDATIPNTAEYAGSETLHWTSIILNSGAITGVGDAAVHKAVYLGDVTGNRGYSTLDAAFTQRVSVGLDTGFDPYLLTDPLLIADINASGQLEGTDALEIARKAVLLATSLIPDLPNVLPPLYGDGLDPTVSFGTATLTRGQRTEVGLSIDTTATGLLGVELTVRYDTGVFSQTAGDFTLGARLAGYNVVTNQLADGRQIIGAYNTTPVSGAGGELFRLSLNTRSDAPLGATTLRLSQDPSLLDQGREGELNEGRLVLSFANNGLFTPSVRSAPVNPTGIGLTSASVAENLPAGTVVGTLSTIDPNPEDTTFTYTFVTGTGSTDNGRFEIVGNQLRTREAFNFEARTSYSVLVQTTDPTGRSFQRSITISVSNANEAPTALNLSANTVAENAASGTVIGTFSTTDPDAGNTFTYSLLTPGVNIDNQAFSIVGNQLRSFAVFDFEAKSSYSVVVRTTDQGGLSFDRTFTVSITNLNEAPTAVVTVNPVTAFSANTSTASPVRVADLSIIDDALGSETLSLTGRDAGLFELSGTQLRFRAGTPLRQLADSGRTGFSVTVQVDDPTVGGSFDASVVVTVGLSDMNSAPTAVTFVNAITTLPESTSTAAAVRVADISITDDATGTNQITLAGADAGSFVVLNGNQLHLRAGTALDFESGKRTYAVTVNVDDSSVGGAVDASATFTVNISDANDAPSLDASGNPFAVLGAGSRQSTEMRQGVLVSDILARSAGGNPISDPDTGALKGIALTAVDQTLGNFQYTLVTNSPQESDWVNVDAAGAISNTSALLLPTTARLRFTTGRIPHHASAPFFLSVESKLDAGLTFRAWDQTSGAAGGRADTSTNGGTSAFSSATETSKVYFEVRLFRSFNPNANLNVYTLEAEFNALTGGAFQDRSTSAYTGFTVLLSAVPELGTSALFRLYFGVQFNSNGTEIDMGYRYLTSNGAEAEFLESIGPASKRPQREGAYFREQGLSNGTGIIGYIYTTQQPGTLQMRQMYRTDIVQKATRPPGTSEGGTPTSFTPQENGDHVYTTNTAFESTKLGTWRIEDPRGFVRELTPNPVAAPAVAAALAERTTVGIESAPLSAASIIRSAALQSPPPVPSMSFPLVAEPGNDNINRLFADQVSRHGSGSAVDRPDVALTPHETSGRDTDPAGPAGSRTISTSVNLEFLDEAFLDQTFVDAVTVAI
jgi:hypothetical protein